ncbi:unnamed protein product [Rhizoctonia solani]|uniref:Uncharacterized protein n=1 Tax=Rhizoctonia solani TaxID=456999 RepID=A0A8H2XVC2_9AGAM|nr:unnamed protein product [Rhizoctonia solani]
MPAPLRRSATLVPHSARPLLTQAEYHAALESLVPNCDPHELDIHLTAFYEQWKLELATRDGLDKADYDHLAIVRILRPNHSNRPDRIVPVWMFDPDERRDKLQHLRCYRLRVIIPGDDSCWARACRSARGLDALFSESRTNRQTASSPTTEDANPVSPTTEDTNPAPEGS